MSELNPDIALASETHMQVSILAVTCLEVSTRCACFSSKNASSATSRGLVASKACGASGGLGIDDARG